MEALATQTYRNYIIKPVFDYDNGKHDFQIYRKDADYGSICPYQTLEQVREDIDERIAEQE